MSTLFELLVGALFAPGLCGVRPPTRSSLPSCSQPSRTLRAANAVARRRAILDRHCARRHEARAGRGGRVRSAKLDAAEVAARDLLARFPDQPDGWDRLGMVYEARGENQKAAEAYRKVIEFIRQHPEAHPPGFEDPFVTLVDRLDPPQPRS
jgi:tetratricopeptide (TPR) repeat protein